MPPNVSKTSRLVQLTDAAISAAQRERSSAARDGKSWLMEDCDVAITNLRAIREQASSGRLPLSNGAGLGITRAFSEWDVSAALYAAGQALEDYYRDEYGA
jgi:hypothetical protein